MNKEIKTSTIKIINPIETKSGTGFNFEYLWGVFWISKETLHEFGIKDNSVSNKVIELVDGKTVSYSKGFHFITPENINNIT